jgi:hypothetical protein
MKTSLEMTYACNSPSLQKVTSDINANPLFTYADSKSSLPLNRIYAVILVKTNENHTILITAFPHLQAISSRTYFDWLDRNMS